MKKQRQGLIKRAKEWLKRIGTLNLILILVGAFFLWFNWQMLSIFREQGAIPETYACAVITATIGECGICGWIRTTKDKHRNKDTEGDDPSDEDKEAEG
jgi:ammonia channel protein AmtB